MYRRTEKRGDRSIVPSKGLFAARSLSEVEVRNIEDEKENQQKINSK